MNETRIAGFTFQTDGSRLICKPGLRAREFLHAMEEDSIIKLSHFVLNNMQWVNTNYTNLQRSVAEESYESMSQKGNCENATIKKIMQVGETLVPIYYNSKTVDKSDVKQVSFDKELIDAVCIIFNACAPYLWENDPDCATDGFYGGEIEYGSYISRNYKELINSLFGAYTSSFPVMKIYDLKNIQHAFKESNTPIEHIAIISQSIKDASSESSYISDYLSFGLSTKEIKLTPQRLINWINKYGSDRAFTVMTKLVEAYDYPWLGTTIEATGDMNRIENRCDRVLRSIAINEKQKSKERMKKWEIDTYNMAKGHIYNFDREPDGEFHNCAIYALRSAIDLSNLGDTLHICVGGERYSRGIDTGKMQLYVIDGNDRQYVAHIEEGKLHELRGYKNHTPIDDEITQAALHCLELSHV